ncbi:MAG: hypothetical protein HC909_01400 [Blastochloris sp.]|nr:hypothetical protein [Blastochloris sp.]
MDPILRAGIKSELQSKGFQVLEKPGDQVTGGFQNNCLLWIALSFPEGGTETLFDKKYGEALNFTYWYKNELYSYRPRFLAAANVVLSRLSIVTGARPMYHAIYHIAYMPECSINLVKDLSFDAVPFQ